MPVRLAGFHIAKEAAAFDANLTIKEAGTEYVIPNGGLLQVRNNAVLTVAPGVTFKFTNTSGGIQIAGGAIKGSWNQVLLENVTTENEFAYCDFINDGSRTDFGNNPAVRVQSEKRIFDHGGGNNALPVGKVEVVPADTRPNVIEKRIEDARFFGSSANSTGFAVLVTRTDFGFDTSQSGYPVNGDACWQRRVSRCFYTVLLQIEQNFESASHNAEFSGYKTMDQCTIDIVYNTHQIRTKHIVFLPGRVTIW